MLLDVLRNKGEEKFELPKNPEKVKIMQIEYSLHIRLVYLWLIGRIKTEDDLLKLTIFLDCYKSFFDPPIMPSSLIEEIFLLRKVRTSRDAFDFWQIARYVEECMTGTEQRNLLIFIQNQPINLVLGEIE